MCFSLCEIVIKLNECFAYKEKLFLRPRELSCGLSSETKLPTASRLQAQEGGEPGESSQRGSTTEDLGKAESPLHLSSSSCKKQD